MPPLIFGMGGGEQGNFCADVKVLLDPVTTTICLPIAIANKRISKSPPHSADSKMRVFFISH